MLYSTNNITFIYKDDGSNIIIHGMDKPSDISIREDLSFKSLTFNIIISDSQCRTLFGHDFMRSPNYLHILAHYANAKVR